jgi:uncharacterized protein (UPF0332 family)
MNSPGDRSLIVYRIKRAGKSLQEADNLFNAEFYEAAVNRLYYACFYSVTALLVTEKIQVKSHAGVKQMFGEHFIKPEKINKEQGRFYAVLFSYRQDSDYLDFAEISREFTGQLLTDAVRFVTTIKTYLIQNNFLPTQD